MRHLVWIPLSLLVACSADGAEVGTARAPLTSSLWGVDGEAFDPAGRLMDWSYAGYHAGEDPLPDVAAVTDVTDHGATGDGSTDDGAAFEAAIAAAEDAGGGAVTVPAGTYVLRRRLILSSGVVLRGAGRDATVLRFPQPLEDLYPGERNWSFSGGFIQASGSSSHPELTTVTAAASRGDRTITVADASGISTGEWILIQQTDVDGTLMRRLHADLADGGADNVGDVGMRFPTRVTGVAGDAVTLERALPLDLESQWSPTVFAVDPRLSEIGVEHLAIEFPHTTYPGHFNELGYNGIHFNHAWNSWVRDVRIVNADYGVSFTGCFFSTAQGVVLATAESRGSDNGHHGLNNGHGGDNLFIDFDVQTGFIHDLTNEWYAHGVVFTRGRGSDLSMDHHRAAPYSTLWTEIHTGAGTQPFRSGGSADRGPHTAAYDTLWNVVADAPMGFPPGDYGPRMNYVGFGTDEDPPSSAVEWHVEDIPPAELEPPNLWEAMRARRLGPGPGEEDAGTALPDAGATDAGATADAGGSDAGEAAFDAGDPALDDDRMVTGGGCGCGAGRGSPPAEALVPLAVVTLLLRRRRR